MPLELDRIEVGYLMAIAEQGKVEQVGGPL